MGRWKGISTFWIYLFIFDVCDILLRTYEINLLRDEDTMFFGPEIAVYIYLELNSDYSDVLNYCLKEWMSFKTFWGINIEFANIDFFLKNAGHDHSWKCFRKILFGKHLHKTSFLKLLDGWRRHLEIQLWAWYPLSSAPIQVSENFD